MAITNGFEEPQEPGKLILCFDGTGNKFTGSNADTNVIKILNKLDRHHPKQYHYYQTGVGTYDINETSVNKSFIGKMQSSISQTIDSGFGTTFDAHVLAGYRFLMRYYTAGDKIYMFGFSRGAFTAKFLARIIHTVGLLCKGNEEMVPFAYQLYQRYLAGEVEDFEEAQPRHRHRSNHHNNVEADVDMADGETEPLLNGSCADEGECKEPTKHGHRYLRARDEITAFSSTFCRQEAVEIDGNIELVNIKVFFLGIFDCVNSVAVLEREAPLPVPVKGTAHYVRHAVAVDERRVKFKPALIAQDVGTKKGHTEDVKEVWFPGGHGDVGGGWPSVANDPLDNNKKMTFWQRLKSLWTTRKAQEPTKDIRKDPFQLSDIPLAWMIREMELVGKKHPEAAVHWTKNVNGFKRAFQRHKEKSHRGFMHDALSFGRGTGLFTVLLWKFMEWLPLITRWELQDDKWIRVRFPLNRGSMRDIPKNAVLHESLIWRLHNVPDYSPHNNHGGDMPPCLKHGGWIADLQPMMTNLEEEIDPDHRTYTFAYPV